MNQNQIKQNFSQLCRNNDWKIFKSKDKFPFNSPLTTYALIDNKEIQNNIRHRYVNEKTIDINDGEILDLIKENKATLHTSKEIEFKTLCHFLPLTNKELEVFNSDKSSLKNWYDFFHHFEYVKVDKKDILTFFKYKILTFSNGDIPSIFHYMEKKQLNNDEIHDSLHCFCINHLDKIKNNLNSRNYLLNKISEVLPEYKSTYSELLHLEVSEDLFFDPQLQFCNIYVSKTTLVRNFPLRFKDEEYKKESSADMSDYHNILTTLTTFLNKSKIKNVLKFNSAFLNAKQDTKPYYIISLEHTGNIQEKSIKHFLENAFAYISESSRVSPVKNIFALKDNVKNGLPPLFNSIILQQKLPYKENKSPSSRKI